MIYGWIVNIGEKSWRKRWYLQALTFLQLLEVCIEGIPQFIFEYYIFLTESQTLFQSLQSIQKWFALVSILTVSLSITSATTTLDREEDSRSVYDEKFKKRIQHAEKEYYWKNYKEKNKNLWYIYFVIVYIGRAFEFIPRCIIYTKFIQEFGLKSFGYFAGIYIFILLLSPVNCLRKIYSEYSNDTCIKPLIIISTIVGELQTFSFATNGYFDFNGRKKSCIYDTMHYFTLLIWLFVLLIQLLPVD
ncbi:uncharacterized protein LOC134257043 [Saccostrea cucullata]|uniref:uncharacterized protein LOC134257043 n=1 Tax=Saccostrea cuccullata TaxID=36930 RepID=UPI002ED464F4